jgi:hypothetical protein
MLSYNSLLILLQRGQLPFHFIQLTIDFRESEFYRLKHALYFLRNGHLKLHQTFLMLGFNLPQVLLRRLGTI